MTGRVVKMSGPEPARMASMSRESPDVICTSLWIFDRPEAVPRSSPAEPFLQALELGLEAVGEAVAELGEEGLDFEVFRLPGLWIDPQELFHVLVVDEQPRKIEILYFRHQADGRFQGPDFAVDSFAHPFQYPAVFPEAGPQPPPVVAPAEPVDVKHPGGFGAQPISHLEPMLDIVP